MKTYLDCMPCFIRQALDSVRLVTDDEMVHEQVIRYVLKLATDLDMSQSPPAIGWWIHRSIRKLTGNDDPYCESKKRFNRLALEICDELEDIIGSSEDPLETAIRLAIAGNIIDLGVKTLLAKSDIEKIIADCLEVDFDKSAIEEFENAVHRAERILSDRQRGRDSF